MTTMYHQNCNHVYYIFRGEEYKLHGYYSNYAADEKVEQLTLSGWVAWSEPLIKMAP